MAGVDLHAVGLLFRNVYGGILIMIVCSILEHDESTVSSSRAPTGAGELLLCLILLI